MNTAELKALLKTMNDVDLERNPNGYSYVDILELQARVAFWRNTLGEILEKNTRTVCAYCGEEVGHPQQECCGEVHQLEII